MSFPTDPVLLFADGEAHARLLPESAQGGVATAMGGAFTASLLAAAIGSYLDAKWARPLWRAVAPSAKSGTDFMLAYPIAHGRTKRRRTPRTDAVAVVMFALYPVWWWLGWDHGRRRRPRG